MPNRRAALSALTGAAGALLVPRVARAAEESPGVELSVLIAEHREAFAAFGVAIDELEAAKPDGDTLVAAIGECTWTLRNGRERIASWIEDHFRQLARGAETVAAVSPTVGAEALAILERERDAAARLRLCCSGRGAGRSG